MHIIIKWVFSNLSEQKLQTGLLKMHMNSLPFSGRCFWKVRNIAVPPGNGCKQSSTQLINYTLSGKMKMPSKLF